MVFMRLVCHIDPQLRLLPPGSRPAKIPEVLLQRCPRLEVVDRVRGIERRKGEIVDGKPPLCQQRAEYKNRIVAGQIGLFEVNARQISRLGGGKIRASGLAAGRVNGQVGIMFQCSRDRLGEG